MIVRDLEAFVFGSLRGQPNPLAGKRRRAIMSSLLFVLEIFLVVGGIAVVPARSELRVSRTRGIYNEHERGNSLRLVARITKSYQGRIVGGIATRLYGLTIQRHRAKTTRLRTIAESPVQ